MHKQIYERLKEVARAGTTIPYSKIAPVAGLDMRYSKDRREIGVLLDEINHYEHSQNKPMLSSVVIYMNSSRPAQGYFKCARDLGLFTGNDEGKFHLQELRRVHEYWASH